MYNCIFSLGVIDSDQKIDKIEDIRITMEDGQSYIAPSQGLIGDPEMLKAKLHTIIDKFIVELEMDTVKVKE